MKKDKSPYRNHNNYEISDKKLLSHKKKRAREK